MNIKHFLWIYNFFLLPKRVEIHGVAESRVGVEISRDRIHPRAFSHENKGNNLSTGVPRPPAQPRDPPGTQPESMSVKRYQSRGFYFIFFTPTQRVTAAVCRCQIFKRNRYFYYYFRTGSLVFAEIAAGATFKLVTPLPKYKNTCLLRAYNCFFIYCTINYMLTN